jgi:hypothetical protein
MASRNRSLLPAIEVASGALLRNNTFPLTSSSFPSGFFGASICFLYDGRSHHPFLAGDYFHVISFVRMTTVRMFSTPTGPALIDSGRAATRLDSAVRLQAKGVACMLRTSSCQFCAMSTDSMVPLPPLHHILRPSLLLPGYVLLFSLS